MSAPHPIVPAKLLEQARELAGFGAGPGRPATIKHRSAVSLAYYAAFHAITLAAARHVLPAGAPDQDAFRVARWINHRDLDQTCAIVAACAVNPKANDRLPRGLSRAQQPLWELFSSPTAAGGRASQVAADLRFIAQSFADLKRGRVDADYNHLARFPKATAVGYVSTASDLLDRLAARGADAYLQRFLACVVGSATGFPRRG